MNPFDFLIAIFLLMGLINGYRKGAVRDALQFVVWLPMFYFTAWILISGEATNGQAMEALETAGIIFMVSYIAVWILDLILIRPTLENLFGKYGSGGNKFLGLLTGAFRGVFVILFIYIAYATYFQGDEEPEFLQNSQAMPYVKDIAQPIQYELEIRDWLPVPKSAWEFTKEEHMEKYLKDKFGIPALPNVK